MDNEHSSKQKLDILFNKYKLKTSDKKYLLSIIYDIFIHDEFQKRMTNLYPHHGDITLGEHILEVTIVTYILSKKHKKDKNYKLDVAIKMAMFHDLYTLPWQNNSTAAVKKFNNKHGFRHPIEAVINASTWYPDLFDENKEILIDGIIHHMHPLPVSVFYDNKNNLSELKNYDYIDELNIYIKELIIESSNRHKMMALSFSRCLYKEGRVMSIADKLVSIRQIKNLDSAISLITGRNKKLER